MTLDKVIERVRNLKSGYDVSDEDIIRYINEAEMEIIGNVISNREGDNEIVGTYGNYQLDTDRGFELLVPSPYDRIYESYCAAQIDRDYEEAERYPVDMSVYNQLRQDFGAWWFRTHPQKKRYNFHIG